MILTSPVKASNAIDVTIISIIFFSEESIIVLIWYFVDTETIYGMGMGIYDNSLLLKCEMKSVKWVKGQNCSNL